MEYKLSKKVLPLESESKTLLPELRSKPKFEVFGVNGSLSQSPVEVAAVL